jgi:hypothetical protein
MKYKKLENKIDGSVHNLRTFFKSGDNVWLGRALNSSMAKAFKREVARNIYAQIEFITPDRIALVTHRLTKSINGDMYDVVVAIFIENGFLKRLSKEAIDKFLLWAGGEGGQAFYDKANIGGTYDLKDPDLIRVLGERANYLIDTVDKTTKDWIVRQIQDGVDEGLTNQEIAERLHKSGKNISMTRAELITHAETSNAMNTVEHRGMRNTYTKKRWVTSHDNNVTDDCRRNEEEGEVPMDYRYGEEGVLYPPRFPRCRCYIEPVIESRLPVTL